jgi:hypothetical protein
MQVATIFHFVSSLADIGTTDECTCSSIAGVEETIEDILEQLEGAMREIGVKLNELSGRVLEIIVRPDCSRFQFLGAEKLLC